MSAQLGKLTSLILTERFGEVIDKVSRCLFSKGPSTLLFIKRTTELPLSKVKESLCILIKYRLVTFKPNFRNENVATYTLHPDQVLLMLRYPKYINLIKKKFGDVSEALIEEVLQRGSVTASDLLLKVYERLTKDSNETVSMPEIRDKLESLIVAKYLKRLPKPKEEKAVPELIINELEVFLMPNLNLKKLSEQTPGNITDEGGYLGVNYDRFHQDIRDNILVDAIANKFDKNAGELTRIFLQQMYIRTEPWADVSNPVPTVEVRDSIKKMNTHPELVLYFEQYLNVLEQDNSGILRKAGEASGGSYQIYIKKIFTQLSWEVIEQIVLEKFDSKAARIFRLVKAKKYIEPEQLQQLAMIPAKEAKRLTYELLEENFLQIQELKKSSSQNGPVKSFTLFHIQLDQIVRMAVELCYKSLFNVISRRYHDKFENKRIIDKKQRIDTILHGMQVQGATEEQLADIEEMLTPPEREILDKIDKTMKKLNILELEIDQTLFLLEMYLMYE